MSELIVDDIEPRVQYVANGTQTVFPFPFPVLETGELVVRFGDAGTPASHVVAGLGASAGGTVTFAAAPAAGTRISLWRRMAVKRLTDFQEAGEFRARAINAELDRLALMVQDAVFRAERAVAPPLASTTAPQALPPPAADAYLKWDGAGETLIADTTVPDAVASTAADAAASAVSAAAASTSAGQAATQAASAAASASAAAASATAAAQARSDFGIVAVPGKASLAADQASDTLTLIEGAGLTFTPDAANDSITFALADGGVSTAKLADGGVTTAKLNDGAVTAAKIDSAVVLGVPAGSVIAFAGSSAPAGWLLCYGQAVSRSTYAVLFAALSTTYGTGDGSTTFNLPDLRGRVAAGKDDMGGSAASRLTSGGSGINGATLGASGGADTHTLTTAQMPAHSHMIGTSMSGSSGAACSDPQSYPNSGSMTTSSTGSGNAHNNAQPTLVLNYIVKT